MPHLQDGQHTHTDTARTFEELVRLQSASHFLFTLKHVTLILQLFISNCYIASLEMLTYCRDLQILRLNKDWQHNCAGNEKRNEICYHR